MFVTGLMALVICAVGFAFGYFQNERLDELEACLNNRLSRDEYLDRSDLILEDMERLDNRVAMLGARMADIEVWMKPAPKKKQGKKS